MSRLMSIGPQSGWLDGEMARRQAGMDDVRRQVIAEQERQREAVIRAQQQQAEYENQVGLLRERQAGEMALAQQRSDDQRWNTTAGINGNLLQEQLRNENAYGLAKYNGANRLQLADMDNQARMGMSRLQHSQGLDMQRMRDETAAQQAELQRQHQMQMTGLQNDFTMQRDQSQNEMQRGNLFDEMAAKQLQAGRDYTPEQQQSLAQVESEIEALHRSVQNNEVSFRDAKPAFKALEDKRNAIRIAPRGFAPVQVNQLQGRGIGLDRAGPLYFHPDGKVQQLNDVVAEQEMAKARYGQGTGNGGSRYDPMRDAQTAFLKQKTEMAKLRGMGFDAPDPDPVQFLKEHRVFFPDAVGSPASPLAPQAESSPQDFVGPETPQSLSEQDAVGSQEAQAIRQRLSQLPNDPTIAQALRVGGPAAQQHYQNLVRSMSAYADSIDAGREDINAVGIAKNARGELMRMAQMGSESGMMMPDAGGMVDGAAMRSLDQQIGGPNLNGIGAAAGAMSQFRQAQAPYQNVAPYQQGSRMIAPGVPWNIPPQSEEDLRYRRRRR